MKENMIPATNGNKNGVHGEAPAAADDTRGTALPTTIQQELLTKSVVRENTVVDSTAHELLSIEQDLLAKGVTRVPTGETARRESAARDLITKGVVRERMTQIPVAISSNKDLRGDAAKAPSALTDLEQKIKLGKKMVQVPSALTDLEQKIKLGKEMVQAPSALTDLEQKMTLGTEIVQAPSALTDLEQKIALGEETTSIGMGIQDHMAIQPLSAPPDLARQPETSMPGAYATPGAYALSFFTNGVSQNQNSNETFNTITAADARQPAIIRAEAEEDGLAVANPVDENSERNARLDLPRAVTEEQVREENLRKKRKTARRQTVQMILFGLCLVLVIVIPFVLLQENTTSELATRAPIPANSSAESVADVPPLSPDEATLRALLPEYTLDKIMNETGSPQAQAYQWMLRDPILRKKGLAWRVKQRFALVATYFATSGENWFFNTNWLEHDTHECMWWSQTYFKEVHQYNDYDPVENAAGTCELLAGQDTVQYKQAYSHLWLGGNNLNGTMPPELFWLTSLRSLSLRDNENLIGSIPTQIGVPKNLEGVSFAGSSVTGTLPSEIGTLSSLLSFSCPAVQLTGSLPSELGLLTRLIELYLDYNAFSGELPAELGNLTNLRWLYLGDNFFAETFPEWILNLTKLDELVLHGAGMNGTIPSGIGKLTDLQQLWLFENQLSGAIPSEIGLLTKLSIVYLEQNQLTGTLPTELGQLVNMGDFWTSWNSLTGTVPSEMGMCSVLYYLELGRNNLSGSIPTELGLLPNDWSFNSNEKFYVAPGTQMRMAIHENQLSGPIPSELGKRDSLGILYLQGNYLSGGIPSELGAINNMTLLRLDSNNLSGELPPALLALPSLELFNVSDNPLLSGGMAANSCESLHLECSDILCGCGCPCHNTTVTISDDSPIGSENNTASTAAANSNQTSG